jgi:predicted PurR-regulated permease PerM
VVVLPVAVALTIAPALSPVASWFRGRRHLERPAAALALLTGLAMVRTGRDRDGLRRRAIDDSALRSRVRSFDIAGELEGEPLRLSAARTEELQSSLADAWREASGHAAAGLQTGAGIVAGIVLAVAMLYFVLRDGAALWTGILQRCSPEVRPAIDRAGRRAWDVLGGYVRGTATVATIDAVLIGIGLVLLDVPLAFALAVLMFMGSFIPYVGAFLSGLVAVLVGFADGGWQLALSVLVLIVVVQFTEGTFLQPMIQSRRVELHPAVILLAVAAGGSLFGIPGAYLVPVTAVVAAVYGSLTSEPPEPEPHGGDEPWCGSGVAAARQMLWWIRRPRRHDEQHPHRADADDDRAVDGRSQPDDGRVRVEHLWGLHRTRPLRSLPRLVLRRAGRVEIELTIDAASVDTGVAARGRHLRSADFFDVAEHPQVRFASTGVSGLGNGHVHVSGDLEVAGASVPVAFDASVRVIDGELELEATTAVDQGRFGMSQGPFRNVRPPTKLHVKTRLVRERSE